MGTAQLPPYVRAATGGAVPLVPRPGRNPAQTSGILPLPVPAFSFSPRAGHSCGKRATRFPNPYLPFFPDLWNKVFLYYSEIINLFLKKRLTFALQPFTRLPQNAAKKHLFQINTQEYGKIGKKPFPAGFALSLALVPAPWQPTCIWPPCRTLPGIRMFPTRRCRSR